MPTSQLPNGARLFIGLLPSTSKAMSAVSNANPAVATLEASHGVLAGDIFVCSSGWADLDNRVVKAGTVTTNDVVLLGVNSTSTTYYPAGGGVGSIREVSGSFIEILEPSDFTINPGSQEFAERQPMAAKSKKRRPTVRGATEGSFKILNDITGTYFTTLDTLSKTQEQAVLKILLPGGGERYMLCYFSLADDESMAVNSFMEFEVSFSKDGPTTRY